MPRERVPGPSASSSESAPRGVQTLQSPPRSDHPAAPVSQSPTSCSLRSCPKGVCRPHKGQETWLPGQQGWSRTPGAAPGSELPSRGPAAQWGVGDPGVFFVSRLWRRRFPGKTARPGAARVGRGRARQGRPAPGRSRRELSAVPTPETLGEERARGFSLCVPGKATPGLGPGPTPTGVSPVPVLSRHPQLAADLSLGTCTDQPYLCRGLSPRV